RASPRPLVVERRLEDLRGTEDEDPPGLDHDLAPGLGIASDSLLLLADLEVAEARDLHLLAPLEALLDGLEDRLDDLSGFLLGAPHPLVDALDDLGLGHGRKVDRGVASLSREPIDFRS